MSRPDFDEYLMGLARAASVRGTCSRRAVGALLAVERRVVLLAYNGAPAGAPHCDHECYARPEDDPDLVRLGDRWSCTRVAHAEANLVAFAARYGGGADGAAVYTTTHPCIACARLLVSAGVREIIFADAFHEDAAAARVCRESGVLLRGLR